MRSGTQTTANTSRPNGSIHAMARPKDMFLQRAARAIPRSTFAAIALSARSACAELPPAATSRALYVDAQKALNGESRLGWTVDRIELEQAAAEVEPSACRMQPADRAALRKWVGTRIAARGGPA